MNTIIDLGTNTIIDSRLKKVYVESINLVTNVLGDNIVANGHTIKEVSVNNRLQRVHGRCFTSKSLNYSKIEISKNMLNVDYEELKTTMIHEILHSLKDCQSHKGKWKEYANIISKNTKYNITRCRNIENFDKDIKYKYIFKCEKCGTTIKRIRQSDFTRHPENYCCSACKGKFKLVNE